MNVLDDNFFLKIFVMWQSRTVVLLLFLDQFVHRVIFIDPFETSRVHNRKIMLQTSTSKYIKLNKQIINLTKTLITVVPKPVATATASASAVDATSVADEMNVSSEDTIGE